MPGARTSAVYGFRNGLHDMVPVYQKPLRKFFHSQGHIHRDIKPDNMLCWGSADIETSPGVTERVPQVKLSDFGLARTVDEMTELYTRNVDTSHRAPDLLHGKYNNSVDLFAAGCTFFALVLAEQSSDKLDDGFPNRFQHIPASSLLAKVPFESPQLKFVAMLTQRTPRCASRRRRWRTLSWPAQQSPRSLQAHGCLRDTAPQM